MIHICIFLLLLFYIIKNITEYFHILAISLEIIKKSCKSNNHRSILSHTSYRTGMLFKNVFLRESCTEALMVLRWCVWLQIQTDIYVSSLEAINFYSKLLREIIRNASIYSTWWKSTMQVGLPPEHIYSSSICKHKHTHTQTTSGSFAPVTLTYGSIIDVLSKAKLYVTIDFSSPLGPLALISHPFLLLFYYLTFQLMISLQCKYPHNADWLTDWMNDWTPFML